MKRRPQPTRPGPRAGITLIEVALELTIIAVLASLSAPLIRDVLRATPRGALTAEGVAMDAACDQLRRELSAGARLDGGDLVSGTSRWHHDADTLYHDGAVRLTACVVTWTRQADWWQLTLAPRRGATRTLTVWAGSPASGSAP